MASTETPATSEARAAATPAGGADARAKKTDEVSTSEPPSRTKDELAARNAEVWRRLRGAVRDLGRSGLGAELRPGWRYHDVVAHVIGWMQQGVRELRTREFRNDWTRATIDAFNERSVDQRRLVGAEALLDELDTSYRLLTAEIAALAEEDLDKARGPVSFYAWHHWEDHVGELEAKRR